MRYRYCVPDQSSPDSLERIIVVPRNGYANRLQSWASAAILGAEFDVPVHVLWEPEKIAVSPTRALFDSDLIEQSFISSSEFIDLTGRAHQEFPRYLYLDPEQNVMSLAGHDRGEQGFMLNLMEKLNSNEHAKTLVITAGGKFHVPGVLDFDAKRRQFYAGIQWSPQIREAVDQLLEDQEFYIGTHWRQTDRSIAAPTRSSMESAAVILSRLFHTKSVFVAADGQVGSAQLSAALHARGLQPWSSTVASFDRTSDLAGVGAIIDWILLGRAQAIAYSSESSFGHEAAVATGHLPESIGLRASRDLQTVRAVRERFDHLLAYLKRQQSG